MSHIAKGKKRGAAGTGVLFAPLLVLLSGCDSAPDDDLISNELMTEMYPDTFRPGSPAYRERDFEAGADFICDEIKAKHQRDICSESEINWR